MQIAEKTWVNYINEMSKISDTAAGLMRAFIEKNGIQDRKKLIDYACALADRYGEAIAELSCQMYEATALAQGVTIPAAEPSPIPSYGEVAKAINGTIKQSEILIPNTVGRLVKQVGADTTLKNAKRDRAQFAWIPHGDTCAFCMTLASRGWQYISDKTLKNGHAEHIHSNCDCQYAVRFDTESGVEGYDSEKYFKMYRDAEGRTPNDKINAMRRSIYASKKMKLR